MPRRRKVAAPATAGAAAREQEVVYNFVQAKRAERCYRRGCRIAKYDLHARSTNGKRRICCDCWDGNKS